MNKIQWESWNEKEKDLAGENKIVEEEEPEFDDGFPAASLMSIMSETNPQTIQTPFGVVSAKSKLKPSDRWDCWLGHTNFGITEEVANKILEVEGVDALKIMSRYSFCIGVGQLFKSAQVKEGIHNAICDK